MLENRLSSRSRGAIIIALVATTSILGMLVLSSGSVMAASLTINSDSITTDDGDIDGVTVDASGDVTWDGAEEQPGETEVKLQVEDPDGEDWNTIDTKEEEELSGLAGTYSFSFSDVDVTDDSDWSESDFVSSTDGSTKDTELNFRLVIETDGDLNGDDSSDTATSNPATTTLSVTNEESSTGFGASGGIEGEGTDKDPEDNEQEEDDD
jgi:hypothetical protein